MKIDWTSTQTEILINPRMPQDEAQRWQRALSEVSLQSHFWLSTSGSSGKSKWVALSKKAVLTSARGVNEHLQCDSLSFNDRWLHVLPSFHVGGLGIWARSFLSGAEVIDLYSRLKKWDVHEFVKVACDSQATLSALVPTQIFDLVQSKLQAPSSLRAIIVGGGALADSLYREAIKLGWPLLPSYGLTECGSQVATASMGALDPTLQILPHVQVQIDPQGLIQIQSEALLTLYAIENQSGCIELKDPIKQGWFTTEDFGSVSGKTLSINGRKGSFLKIGGESVDFSRLEKIFEQVRLEFALPDELFINAIPDERLGYIVQLVTALPRDQSTLVCEVIEKFNQRVLPIERIRETRWVDVIPRSPLGKILTNWSTKLFFK